MNEDTDDCRKPARISARTLLIVTVASLVVTVVSLVVAVQANTRAQDAQDAIDQVIAQRTESRQATCGLNAKFAMAHNNLVVAIATAGGTREISAELQPKVDEQIVPIPDCTPAGILDFYEGDKP